MDDDRRPRVRIPVLNGPRYQGQCESCGWRSRLWKRKEIILEDAQAHRDMHALGLITRRKSA